jgi:hypothetical protein
MKRFFGAFVVLIGMSGCIKNNIKTGDLLSSLSITPAQVLADGTSVVTISTTVNGKADSTKRNVLFSATGGKFIGGTDSIVVNAVYVNTNLVATAKLIAPLSPQTVTIKAKMNLANEKTDYTQTATITAAPSVPAKITLSASAFAVKVNFGSEVTITGALTNAAGNPVSLGNKVVFVDTYEDNTPVNGRFRQLQNSSNNLSSVSAIYSPGYVPVNKDIRITCYLTDSLGNRSIPDTVLINTISN